MNEESASSAAPIAPVIPQATLPSPTAKSRLPRLAIAILIIVVLFAAWEISKSICAYTADAYVRADLVALAPQITGHLIEVAVTDNQQINRGDLLVKIDPEPFQLAVDSSQATLQEANADAGAASDSIAAAQDDLNAATAVLQNAAATESRAASLGQAGFASRKAEDDALSALRDAQAAVAAKRALLDHARAQLAATQAAVAVARAELNSAEWELARTVIRSPVDGTVNNLNLQIGDTAQADTPLIGIIAAHSWRIIANYKQSYLPALHPGQTAWVWLDSHPWHLYRARVAGIGRGISRQPGDTGLLPYVAPTTDWIRLQHRFPVTIDLIDPPADLTLYMGADANCLIFP